MLLNQGPVSAENKDSISLSCITTGATWPCRVRWWARCTRSARWTRTSRTSLTRSRGELRCALLLSSDSSRGNDAKGMQSAKFNQLRLFFFFFPGHWITDGWSLRWKNGTSSHDKRQQGETAAGLHFKQLTQQSLHFPKNQYCSIDLNMFLQTLSCYVYFKQMLQQCTQHTNSFCL